MKYTFLLYSNQPFYSDLKTNKWHVATRLAERGHNVIYVDPPLRFKALKEFLKNPSLHLSSLFMKTNRENEHLIVYGPANIFNFWPFSSINTRVHSRKLKSLLNQFEDSSPLIMYIYHFDFPDLREFLAKFEYDLLIYDVVDEYTAFPEYSDRKKVNSGLVSWIQWIDDELKIQLNQGGKEKADWVLYIEQWLAETANLVFASAPGLVTKFKKWSDHVSYLPNAAATKVFDVDKDKIAEPDDLKSIPHPRIGFTGAIDAYKNNISLIEKSAEAYPNYHFVLIGPEKLSDPDLDLTKLKGMSNVHFLGQKPLKETPEYFAHFDAYFIPYNLNDYIIKGNFPVKYFEALAAGLPTVVTDIPPLRAFDVDGYVSKDDDAFVNNLKRAIENDSDDKIKKRKELAAQNTWDGKVEKQLALIKGALDG